MLQNNILIAKKTLKLLEVNSWTKISFSKIVNNKNNNIKNKKDLITNVNRYFDFLLKENLISLENSSTKDMLFEVLMARLDILNIHRKSIQNLIKYFSSNPHKFILHFPSILESVILMSTLSNVNISGIQGITKLKSIFILYLLIIYTWNQDDTEQLEKTMTTLDKYLNFINKFVNLE